MVAYRLGDLRITSLDDDEFSDVLAAAQEAGGIDVYPVLFALAQTEPEILPQEFMVELARLSGTEAGREQAALVGRLRDDLMSGLATLEEG
jgi:hypothetical protein